MTRALVVVEDPDRDRPLVSRASQFACGADTDIIVVALATPEEYEEIAATLDAIGRSEHTSYDEDAVLEGITGDVDDLAREVLDVDYDVRMEIAPKGEQAETLIDLAAETDCDHVFVPGNRRSPAGKAVFGDRTQRLLLNFPGFVTAAMA